MFSLEDISKNKSNFSWFCSFTASSRVTFRLQTHAHTKSINCFIRWIRWFKEYCSDKFIEKLIWDICYEIIILWFSITLCSNKRENRRFFSILSSFSQPMLHGCKWIPTNTIKKSKCHQFLHKTPNAIHSISPNIVLLGSVIDNEDS